MFFFALVLHKWLKRCCTTLSFQCNEVFSVSKTVEQMLVFHVESIFQWNSFPLYRYIMFWKFTSLINFYSLVSHILCAAFEHRSHLHYCDRWMQCLHSCRASITKSPHRYLLKNIKTKLHWFIRRKKPFVSNLEIFWIADSWQFQVHLENTNCFIDEKNHGIYSVTNANIL